MGWYHHLIVSLVCWYLFFRLTLSWLTHCDTDDDWFKARRQGWHSGSAEELYPTTPVWPIWGENNWDWSAAPRAHPGQREHRTKSGFAALQRRAGTVITRWCVGATVVIKSCFVLSISVPINGCYLWRLFQCNVADQVRMFSITCTVKKKDREKFIIYRKI